MGMSWWAGPSRAQKLFLGSNFDWGQDLLRLKRWCDENPHSLPIAFSFYGAVYPKSVGLQVRLLPGSFEQLDGDGDAMPEIPAGTAYPFYWAISSNVLNGMPGLTLLADGTMQQALVRSPLLKPENAAALVGRTIYIFGIGSPSGQPDSRGAFHSTDLGDLSAWSPTNTPWLAPDPAGGRSRDQAYRWAADVRGRVEGHAMQ